MDVCTATYEVVKPLAVGMAIADETTADDEMAGTSITADEAGTTDDVGWALATVVAITAGDAEPAFLPAVRAATTPSYAGFLTRFSSKRHAAPCVGKTEGIQEYCGY